MYMSEVSNGVLIGGKVIPYDVIGAVGIIIAVLGLAFILYKIVSVKKALE